MTGINRATTTILMKSRIRCLPFFNVGDEYILKRTPQQDDFYHLMNGKICGEAWDAISRWRMPIRVKLMLREGEQDRSIDPTCHMENAEGPCYYKMKFMKEPVAPGQFAGADSKAVMTWPMKAAHGL